MDKRDYYIVSFSDETTIKYTIWFTDDVDGFVTDEGNILVFDDMDELRKYLDKQEITIDSYDDVGNCDVCKFDVMHFVKYDYTNVVCNEILDFCNIISDIATTLGIKFPTTGNDYDSIYEKLFYGCNIPAMNLDGIYIPNWSKKEQALMKIIIDEGIEKIRKYIFDKC